MLYAMSSVFGISARNFRIDVENTHYTPHNIQMQPKIVEKKRIYSPRMADYVR